LFPDYEQFGSYGSSVGSILTNAFLSTKPLLVTSRLPGTNPLGANLDYFQIADIPRNLAGHLPPSQRQL